MFNLVAMADSVAQQDYENQRTKLQPTIASDLPPPCATA
jgi:hypothetical protein